MQQAPSITPDMRYHVTVAGTVSERLLRSFHPMDVRSDGATTTLTVDVRDQAALRGVIDRAGDLGLDLVGMAQIPDVPAPADPAPGGRAGR